MNAYRLRFPEHVEDDRFRDGDVIFGVDGRSFETADSYNDEFLHRETKILPVNVERDGQEIVVSVSFRQIQLLQGRGVELRALVRARSP